MKLCGGVVPPDDPAALTPPAERTYQGEPMSTVHDALRAWAKGLYDREAAVELLIRQGKAIYPGAPWLRTSATTLEGAPIVSIDVDELVHESGAWSGGERRIVDVAASLLSQDHSPMRSATWTATTRSSCWPRSRTPPGPTRAPR